MSNINEQVLIYFYSPNGTYTRINKNLEILGLDSNKRICNIYTIDFNWIVKNKKYIRKFKKYDVIYLDEFYDSRINYSECYEAMKVLISFGKQIVMAGHGTLESLVEMPSEMRKQVVSYDLKYDIDWDYDYKKEYMINCFNGGNIWITIRKKNTWKKKLKR